jgi:hypothetical protein
LLADVATENAAAARNTHLSVRQPTCLDSGRRHAERSIQSGSQRIASHPVRRQIGGYGCSSRTWSQASLVTTGFAQADTARSVAYYLKTFQLERLEQLRGAIPENVPAGTCRLGISDPNAEYGRFTCAGAG